MFRSFDPDDLFGNGGAQLFGYDPVSRLSSLTVDLSGTTSDLTKTFSYNPANQIVSETRSNDAYSQVLANGTQTNVTNGLNQLSTVNGTAAAYDARGNMTTDPVTGKTQSYYGSNNQLWNVPSPYTTFGYDALARLAYFNTGTPVTNYVSDDPSPGSGKADIIAEYDGSNVLQKRYAFDGSGNPLVAYDAAGNRTWMLSDERGSVVALANDSAAMTSINTYDEYGIPAATNQGTFQYAGMMWLSRPGLYAPTFRSFNALLGRFNQTDPIGFGGGINLYGYTGGDPVNRTDPLGLSFEDPNVGAQTATQCTADCTGQEIIVTHVAPVDPWLQDFGKGGFLNGIGGLAEKLFETGGGGGAGQKQSFKRAIKPSNAIRCTSGNVSFWAPPSFNLEEIYLAGEAGGTSISAMSNAVGHFGTFDFQRTRTPSGGTVFTSAYTNAANFAVGVYLAGAGFGQSTAGLISDTYALVNSKNFGDPNQETFRNAGIAAANGKGVACH